MNLDLIQPQREAAHQSFFLLEVQPGQRTVIFLRDTGGLEDVVVKLPRCVRRVENEEGQQEHSLITGLQILQQLFSLCAVGGEVGRE